MNRSLLIAATILIVLVGYFGVRSLARGSISTAHETPVAAKAEAVPEAIVMTVTSQPHQLTIEAKGRTEPDKSVTVKAGTTGNVVSTPVAEGNFVKKGTLLCGLDIEARNARLKEAEAQRNAARIDFEAAQALTAKGLAPKNREASAQANLDAAEAAVNTARVELGKTQIRAPFDGIFETRLAEAGDFLAPGAACGVLVDMSPVIVSFEVAETEASSLKVDMPGTATLADGRSFPASLRYVSRTADGATRTFRVEAVLETGDAVVAAGVTASVTIPVGSVEATQISPALLTLSDTGELGVRFVDNGAVRFASVEVIDENPSGAWVTGLPQTASVIAMGQDYLSEGVKVTTVQSGGASR